MFDIDCDCGVYAHIGTSRQRGRDTDIYVNSHILVEVYAFVKISMQWRMKEKLDAVKLLIVQGKVSTSPYYDYYVSALPARFRGY